MSVTTKTVKSNKGVKHCSNNCIDKPAPVEGTTDEFEVDKVHSVHGKDKQQKVLHGCMLKQEQTHANQLLIIPDSHTDSG